MKYILVLIICFWIVLIALAHGTHNPKNYHPERKKESPSVTLQKEPQLKIVDSSKIEPPFEQNTKDITGISIDHPHTVQDFPTLHPLVVHFPIMFFLIAAIMQLVQFFVFRYELSWVTLILLFLGFVSAIISSKFVHPHTHGLSETATRILKEHELYANWTIWLSGIGCLLKVGSHFVFKRKVWAEVVVSLVVVGAAYAVSMAGHHGAQLVHIEGVGPQGKFLEKEEQ